MGDDVLAEEPLGAFVGGRRESDDAGGGEVFEDLAPPAIDRPVTFVDHDQVEVVRRECGVRPRRGNVRKSVLCVRIGGIGLVFVVGRSRLALEERIESLDRRNDDGRLRRFGVG